MSDKTHVIMAMINYESWAPVAVFPSKEDAETACKILNTRLFGSESGHSESEFTAHAVDFEPDIKHTGKKRYWHKDSDDDTECLEAYPLDPENVYDDIDTPDTMYSLAMAYERGTMTERDWFLKEDE